MAVENFVLFSTLLALAGFACAWASRRAAARGLWRPRPHVLVRLYTLALVAPPVVALWLVAAALLPRLWLTAAAFDAAHSAPHHQLHLLGELTVALEPFLAYMTLSFAVAAAAFAAWSSVRGYLRVGSVIKRLEMNAAPPPPEQLALVEGVAARHGLDVGLVLSDYPLTFVWGFRRSKLVLSSGLLRTLTPAELTGVLEHEAAHHARRDNLLKLALTICSYASLAFPLSRRLLKWRAAEVELVCDEVAAARTSTPLEVASALVKLRRRTLAGDALTGATASSFAPDDAPGFERRVRRLIAFADAPPDMAHATLLARANSNATLLAATAFVTTLVVVAIFAPLAVHHAAEALIQLIT